MKLSLVLALTLLGAVSARQLHEDHLEQEGTAVQDEVKPGELEPPCPMEIESFRVARLGTWGRTYRYAIVTNCQSFWNAQRYCARCYRGRLASIHSPGVNQQLCKAARSRTNRSQVWIGGVTNGRTPRSCWVDRSQWNYSYWANGNVQRARSCVALCTAGGRWRSVNCGTRMPFICEF